MNTTNGTTVQQGSFIMNGRMWYTSLGHTIDIWRDATFQAHIKGGIDWVLETETPASPLNATGIPVAGAASTVSASPAPAPPSSGQSSSNTSKIVMYTLLISTLLASFV